MASFTTLASRLATEVMFSVLAGTPPTGRTSESYRTYGIRNTTPKTATSTTLTMICPDGVSRDISSAGQTDIGEARIGTESVAFDERAFDSRFSRCVLGKL